jgi:outer membrane protein TolC
MPTTRTQRPPLTDRAKKVLSMSRAVVRQEQRVTDLRKKLADAEGELKTQRRLLRDLMGDETTFGADGQNTGALPA